MSNEYDELVDPIIAHGGERRAVRIRASISRLVARLFASAGNPLRVHLLRCLLRPLSPLGAAGVAAGAFAAFLSRAGDSEPNIAVEAVAQVSPQQVYELARFVEQVDPQAFEQFATLASSSPLAMATFSASVLLLLYRRLPSAAVRSTPPVSRRA